MISARLDPTLVASLRQFAKQHGLTMSDALREAILLLLAREETRNVISFNVAITNERSGITANTSFRQDIPAAV